MAAKQNKPQAKTNSNTKKPAQKKAVGSPKSNGKKPSKAKQSTQPAEVCGPDKKEMRRYEVEDGLRTLRRAEEIKSDPKLMKDIKAEATKQVQMMGKIAGGAPNGKM